jgi:hypothetical protein
MLKCKEGLFMFDGLFWFSFIIKQMQLSTFVSRFSVLDALSRSSREMNTKATQTLLPFSELLFLKILNTWPICL